MDTPTFPESWHHMITIFQEWFLCKPLDGVCPKPFFDFLKCPFSLIKKKIIKKTIRNELRVKKLESVKLESVDHFWDEQRAAGSFDSFFCVSGTISYTKFLERRRWICYVARDFKVVWVSFQANLMLRKTTRNLESFYPKILSVAWYEVFSLGSIGWWNIVRP